MMCLPREEANTSSELFRNAAESLLNRHPAIEGVKKTFYDSFTPLVQKARADGNEEDIRALLNIEQCFEERPTIEFDILVTAFEKKAVSDIRLARAAELITDEDYQFLLKVLRNFLG